jgi:putative peptidoglycan lipid II flippase
MHPLRNLLNSPAKSIASAAFLISSTTLLSRIIGIVRDRAFAHYFGIGPVMDAYYAAFKIPDFIYNLLIVGALSTGFIPIFTALYYTDNDKEKAWKLASNMLNIAGITLAVCSGIGIVCAPYIARLVGSGFDASTLELTTRFTRIIFISPVFLGISMVLGGILQSLRHFLTYSLAPILYNVGILLGTTVLYPLIGITGIAWGVVLGALLHTLVQWYGARSAGFTWAWFVQLKNESVRTIGKLMIPRTMGLALTQVNTVAMSIIASRLGSGSVSAFNLANNIQGVPAGIIGIPFALAVFPLLSASAATKTSANNFAELLGSTMRNVLFLIIPVSVLYSVLRAQIVRVLYGSGAFNWDATVITADALAFFSLGLVAQSLTPLLARAFYAYSDTKTPFFISVCAEVCTLVLAIGLTSFPGYIPQGLSPLAGVAGLAFASSLGALCNMALLYLFLHKKNNRLEHWLLIKTLLKTSCAGLAMAFVIQLLKLPLANLVDMNRGWGILLQGLLAGLVGLMTYIGMCTLLRVPELEIVMESLKRRLLKTRVITGAVDDGSSV